MKRVIAGLALALLAGCAAPDAGADNPTVAVEDTTEAPVPELTTTDPELPAVSAGPADVYYKNCTEVKAAGKDPLKQGEPGYRRGLDRDGDGFACDK